MVRHIYPGITWNTWSPNINFTNQLNGNLKMYDGSQLLLIVMNGQDGNGFKPAQPSRSSFSGKKDASKNLPRVVLRFRRILRMSMRHGVKSKLHRSFV